MFGTDGGRLVLGPTHEEAATQLCASLLASHRDLPARLYQIGPKFRNEARVRGGLLRLREFLMQDLYAFDAGEAEARETYDVVCQTYERIFARLALPVVRVRASSGAMGGTHSHEYQLLGPAGEDRLVVCNACGFHANAELDGEPDGELAARACRQCRSPDVRRERGLELGHCFILGTRYTAPFGAVFSDAAQQSRPMHMGCYGIGLSRLLAAVVEASHDEDGIRWPRACSPYPAVVIPRTAQEETHPACTAAALGAVAHETLLLDDRYDRTLAARLKDFRLIGVPVALVLGRALAERGLVEVHERTTHVPRLVTPEEAARCFRPAGPATNPAPADQGHGRGPGR
jgi:prolyl-tRNA synthetase